VTPQAAREAAINESAKHGVPPGATTTDPQRTWIELPAAAPLLPVPVADVLVWIVRFWSGPSWIDLAVSDSSGAVVRVTKSRNFVMNHGGEGLLFTGEAP
jgi:hypothetical protein